MALASGQTLTHYEILGPLGAGGMGEVYRARDTRLERELAIKVLPDELASDEDRLRRFEREAKTLASLSHPNVAHVYGIDQQGDTCFMAMELVQGEDLAQRIGGGALPIHEALDVCRQIAEGLEAAHEAGVVHRDLKPANVRITPEGLVKVLDFGLAKPMNAKAKDDGSTTTAESDSFLMTGEGVVLGTPTYMSPEQARAKAIDRRTDVWSFGCVLYECLSGKRAFDGDTLPDVMAAVVGTEPDWSKLPALPPRVSELLRRTLDKDPRKRLRDMGEARMQLLLATSDPAPTAHAPQAPAKSGGLRAAALTLAGTAVGFLLGWLAGGLAGDAAPGVEPAAKSVDAPEAPDFKFVLQVFDEGVRSQEIGLSPAGTHVAWSNSDGLHVRSVSELEPRTIVDKELDGWAWSPDGTELAYVIEETLTRVPADGGPSVTFYRHDEDVGQLAWYGDDIYFTDEEGVLSVPAGGGQSVVRAELGEDVLDLHGFGVVPMNTGGNKGGNDGGDVTIVAMIHRKDSAPDTIARYEDGAWVPVHRTPESTINGMRITPNGTILFNEFAEGPSTWVLPASHEEPSGYGSPISLSADIGSLSAARDGTVAYFLNEDGMGRQQPSWISLDGTTTTFGEAHDGLFLPHLAPDGRSILYMSGKGFRSIRLYSYDLERGLATPIIKLDSPGLPTLLPDGRIAISQFMSDKGVLAYSPTGKGEPEALSDDALLGVSPDGSVWIWAEQVWGRGESYWTNGEDGEPTTLFDAESGDRFLNFSSDGAWMLYTSSRADESQVYLTRFPPSATEDWAVSAGSADKAWFTDDGSAILFSSGWGSPSVYRVSLTLEPEVRLGTPELLFEAPEGTSITDFDGKDRFLGTVGEPPGERQLVLSTEWAHLFR